MLRSSPHPPSPSPSTALEFLRSVASALQQPDCEAALAAAQGARSRGLLRVAVIGQFKRGKSTLLNALIGRETLPSGVLPLTTVPTEVLDGPGELIVDLGSTGTAVEPLDALAEFVTEARNPDNGRGVRRVQVRVPLPAWARDVVFIDSPGIGSAHDQATGAAHRILAEVDAAILVLSPDPPVSRAELEFVREAHTFASKLFVVINKADLLPGDARSALTDYTRRVLRERAGLADPRVYLLSARNVLHARLGSPSFEPEDEGWATLVSDLDRYLGRDRRTSVLEVERQQIALYAGRLRGIAALNLKSLAMSDREFERAAGAVRTLVDSIPDERRAADALLDGEVAEILAGLDRQLAEFREQQQDPIVDELDAFLRASRATGASSLVREFDRRFRHALAPRVASLRDALERYVHAGLEAAFRRYERRISALLESIDRAAAASFEVELVPVAVRVPLAQSDAYYPHVTGLYDGTFAGQTALLLPALFVRGRIRRGLGRTVAEELDAQSGRLRTDLIDRTHESTRRFKALAAERIERDSTSVENAVRVGHAHRDEGAEPAHNWRLRVESWEREMDALVAASSGSGSTLLDSPGGSV
jgi:ethanolamine utilization protein EutP (predicted NTPase)